MKKLLSAGLTLFAVVSTYGADRSGKSYVPKKVEMPTAKRIIINHTNPAPPLVVESLTLTNRVNPEWLKPSTEPFTLGPGDKIEIELLDAADIQQTLESRQTTTVGPDGKIYFSILPGLDVWGLTLTQTKDLIEKEFARYMRDKPQVGVTLRGVESKKVWLLGRFQIPGVYPIAAPVSLLEVMSLAGGPMSYTTGTGTQETSLASNSEELGDLRSAFIIRKGQLLPVDFEKLVKYGDLTQNIYLQADDFVYIPPATVREVYVMGAVQQPRAVPYQDGMTLVGAIANAGGTFDESHWHHVAVVHGSLSSPEIKIYDYKDIIMGRAPDVPLQPRDIVHVPLKPYRYLKRYLELITDTFVTTMAINEGARAVNVRSQPTGIVIPLGSTITVTAPNTPITVR